MAVMTINDTKKQCSLEDALKITDFGKYSITLLGSCCLLILTMYVDIFAFSVLMPAVACDMQLTTAQQGLLSAVPLVGVMLSSYTWGLCADTLGRRATLLLAMPIGVFFNFAASQAPNYWSLAVLKFLSSSFTSSANAAAFVLLGESVPQHHRSRMMFLMATTTMIAQAIICLFALPIFTLSFHIEISWLAQEYRPWRLLMQVLCIPGILSCLSIVAVKESPKFLLCKGKEDETMSVLKTMYSLNTGLKRDSFPVTQLSLDDLMVVESAGTSFLRKIWNQTAPLFKSPLLQNSAKLYYMLLCAYMTSTGYTMWVPTITNAYFNGDDATGKTFCEVASQSAATKNSSITDCDNTVEPQALYATIIYSAVPGVLTILLSFLVGTLGKKNTTHLVFIISVICGIALIFVRVPMLSIGLFFMFLYVSLILGNVNTYLVEFNPTHLRGMATCLSVVVARGFGFISVQLIAVLVGNYCTPMLSGYVLLVTSGLVVSFLLPAESKIPGDPEAIDVQDLADNISQEVKDVKA